MTIIRSGGAVWRVRGRGRPSVRRARAGVLARTIGVAGLIVGASLGFVPGEAPAVGGQNAAPSKAETGKDANRLAALAEPRPPMPAPHIAVATRAAGPIEPWRLLDPRPASTELARFIASSPAMTGSLTPGFRGASAGGPAPEWREEEFAQVEALDGRTLAARALRIRLSDLELPQGDDICRTLDGRLEACAARAATQLDLMTRHRKVTCRYRLEAAGEAVGTCRIGGGDVAERLLRAGFVKHSAKVARIAMAPQAGAN
jgi:hypothetical protein